MTPPAGGLHRVFLHIGAPKTGTTFVQSVLWRHRELVREHGLLFPGEHYDDHFFAAVDLQQLAFHGAVRPAAAGYWDRVAAAAREWPATTVISHDVFASASAEQAHRAIADLAPAEVHIVCTARDLLRQLPSHWQEDVKHGSDEQLSDWYAAVSRHAADRWSWRWFWQTEELPDVLRRWGGSLPPGRVHLVTVPREDAPRAELWRRFCQVIGLDPGLVDVASEPAANTGLGATEVELLRRVNASLDGVFAQPDYERVVKGVLAHETLARRQSSRVEAPTEAYEATRTIANRWVDDIRDQHVDVVGDLADLLPAAPGAVDRGAMPADGEVAAAGAWAVAQLLRRLHDVRTGHADETGRLHAEVAQQQVELDELHGRLRRIDQHPLVRARFRARRLAERLRGRGNGQASPR